MDVKLIPGIMLNLGWEQALQGVFIGLLLSLVYLCIHRDKKVCPLLPGWFLGAIFLEMI